VCSPRVALIGGEGRHIDEADDDYAAADLALARVLSDLMGRVGIEPPTLG
jgi:hypothetical protein